MGSTVLAWALAQPVGTRAAVLAAAFTGGTGLTYGQQVACDLAQTNHSSLRAGKIEFRRLCEQVQSPRSAPALCRSPRRLGPSATTSGRWSR